MSPQDIAAHVACKGFTLFISVLLGIHLSRLRGLTPENFLERANEMAATTLKAEIADLLERLLVENHVVNFLSPQCRSTVALVDKLIGGSEDLALLNEIYHSLTSLGII
jgi:hypothetical protein